MGTGFAFSASTPGVRRLNDGRDFFTKVAAAPAADAAGTLRSSEPGDPRPFLFFSIDLRMVVDVAAIRAVRNQNTIPAAHEQMTKVLAGGGITHGDFAVDTVVSLASGIYEPGQRRVDRAARDLYDVCLSPLWNGGAGGRYFSVSW
jgi:hypothetical protein